MKVFIPGKKDPNSFFEEIMLHSKCEFVFGHWSSFDPKVHETVIVQWPELIFDWQEPTSEDLVSIRLALQLWSSKTKIIYVVHNIKSHLGNTQNFQLLYNLIEETCDTMVHFGNFSRELFQKKYPKKKHVLIPHPLYISTFTKFDKNEARKKLGMDDDTVVVIAPGKIRKKEERLMLLKAFKKINLPNKILLVPAMYRYTPPDNFPGRYRLKSFFNFNQFSDKIDKQLYRKPKYQFGYTLSSPDDLSLLISAADIVFIARRETLNSGIVFLGLTFRKIIVGPGIGNIQEVLKRFHFPIFNPESQKSVLKSLKEGVKLTGSNYNYSEELLNPFHPIKIAEIWDDLLQTFRK